MKTQNSSLIVVFVAIFSIVAWSVLLYFVGAERIVEYVGVRNGYLIMFLVSLFGGLSSLGGPTYVATAVTLAAGGLNPFTLALFASAGTSVGDTVYFVASRSGGEYLVKQKAGKWLQRCARWVTEKPKYVLWLFVYVYTAFTPFPNDVLTISMGLTRQPYVLIITALAVGNFTFILLLGLFGVNVL